LLFKIEDYERDILSLIGKVAKSLGFPVYIVGGYVRDRLLNRESKDLDIVCVGSGIDLATAVASALHPRPRLSVFKRFGTAMIKHRDLEIEFVGARKESYRQDSRKPTVEKGSLRDDQLRRDFTINALAVSLNSENFGELIDPFNGIKHLAERLIKTPLAPDKTFSDDPLRMMRAIRFASQLNFEIDPTTFESIKKQNSRLSIISGERIITELNKIVLSNPPSRGFKMLFNSGLLKRFFPEMAKLQGVEIREGKSHKDNFYHTLEVLDNISKHTDDLYLRWAAIMHDIAKPPTKRFEAKVGWTFHGHDGLGAAMVPRIFRRLKLPLDANMKFVQKLVKLHLRPISLTKENITDSAIRKLLYEAGDDIDALMMLCKADITSKNPKKVRRYLDNYEIVQRKMAEVEEKDHIRNWQPPISGEQIMTTFNIPPSRAVGTIKTAIKDAILDGDIPNEYEAAFAFMLKKGTEIGLEQANG